MNQDLTSVIIVEPEMTLAQLQERLASMQKVEVSMDATQPVVMLKDCQNFEILEWASQNYKSKQFVLVADDTTMTHFQEFRDRVLIVGAGDSMTYGLRMAIESMSRSMEIVKIHETNKKGYEPKSYRRYPLMRTHKGR